MPAHITAEVSMVLTPSMLAHGFAELDEHEQVAFFVAVAKIAGASGHPGGWGLQLFRVGRWLRAHPLAARVVRDIADGIED